MWPPSTVSTSQNPGRCGTASETCAIPAIVMLYPFIYVVASRSSL